MKILIVEDEAGIVQFLQQGLGEEGYEITSTSDGLKGFNLAYLFSKNYAKYFLSKLRL